ncbi:Unknown protein [Striga hermonthica]|uniref:Transmembrane protein n=1 Tax=Striga hermonthica TaxID=68872 RepID=A0A9N7NNS3_STRHE|nr:Unknown protein [Striga hermonthica]
MSFTTKIFMAIIIIHILLLFSTPTIARHYPILPSAPSTALPKIGPKTRGSFFTTSPSSNHKRQVFHGREINDCMPKGFPHSSAPSRYVNYHKLGSSKCSSGKN